MLLIDSRPGDKSPLSDDMDLLDAMGSIVLLGSSRCRRRTLCALMWFRFRVSGSALSEADGRSKEELELLRRKESDASAPAGSGSTFCPTRRKSR
eukprot:scaffold1152_cov235-Pinguiococcus_pyrenoidosus.AAC.1